VNTIFWIVGDPSADLHCAEVIQELKHLRPELVNVGLGGENMKEKGFVLLHDLCSNAIMGFFEVLKHLGQIKILMQKTLEWIKEYKPELVILVDYPGFNLHIAPLIKRLGIPMIYYISPQVWAWKKSRTRKIASLVQKVLVIFPFEVPIYQQAGVDCVYVGHPLLDRIPEPRKLLDFSEPPYRIALLPGSRYQEIQRIFPVMLETAQKFLSLYPDTEFMVPVLSKENMNVVQAIAGDFPLNICEKGMETVLRNAHTGIVASGTATLESALFKMPFVLVYRTHPLTYYIARQLVSIPYIGIVNILMGKQVVPELIQSQATPEHILSLVIDLIKNSTFRDNMLYAFDEVREILGPSGAGKRTAIEILKTLGLYPVK